ncbi:MAG: secretin N-terminal domain-containing protein [Phycisphaerae bacterium]
MTTKSYARRIGNRLVLVPIWAVWVLVGGSAVGQDGNGTEGASPASPAVTTRPAPPIRRYPSMNDALRARAAASRPASPRIHEPGTISPSDPDNNGVPTPLDLKIRSEADHLEALDDAQLEALEAAAKASTSRPSGLPNQPAMPPRVPSRKPPAPGEAASNGGNVPPPTPPVATEEPQPTLEPMPAEPESQDGPVDEPIVHEEIPAPAEQPAPPATPTAGAGEHPAVHPRHETRVPTTVPAHTPAPPIGRRPSPGPGGRPTGSSSPQPVTPIHQPAITDPNAGMNVPKLDPKTYWKLPYNERPYFFNWINIPLEKCCQDFVEMSGLSMVGLLGEGVNDADRKKPITFQSLELQTFDQALTRFNLITQEVGLGYWTMVRDGYLEFRQLSEWYRRMPAERLYDSQEAYEKAKLPEWEMASMMYTPKHQPAVRLAQWVNDSVPDNCARATLFPDSNWIEIRGCVYHINRALEILAKRDVEIKDGREWRVYPLKHRTPAEASSQLQGMLLPEGLMGGATGAVPANPVPTPQPPPGPPGRPGRSGPVRSPAGSTEIGTSTSDDIEIQEPLSGSSLLVLASPAKHKRIEELLTKYIDVEGSDPRKKEIIDLKHVDPSEMIDLITPFLGEPKMVQQPAPPPKPGQPPTPPPPPQIMKVNTSATLTPRPPRSILVEANDKEMREIKELIALLDVPREESKYQVVKLEHADASSVAMVLTSIITGRTTSSSRYPRPGGVPGGVVGGVEGFKAVPDNTTDRTLVLSGSQQDIVEAKELIKQLDVDPAAGAAEHIVQLKNAEPGSVVQILTTRFGGSSSGGGFRRGPYGYGGYGGGGGQSLPQFIPDDESKMLVVICHDAMWPDINKLINELDEKSETLKTTRSYQIKYANAESVSMLLSQALAGGSSYGGYRRYPFGGGGGGDRQPSFLVNPSTNLLLVTATEEDHVKVAELIQKLDQPSPVDQAEFRPIDLEQADAEYVAEKIEEVLGGEGSSRRRSYRGYDYSYSGGYGSTSEGAPKVPVRVIAETIGNRLLVSASDEDFKKAEALAKEIDAQYIKQEIVRKTFILENTDAWEAQQIISSMFDAQSAGGGRSRYGESYYDRRSGSSTPGSVKIAPMGNGLVVQAPKDKMAEIEKFIAEIDRNPTAGNEVKMYKIKSTGYEGSAGVARTLSAMLGIQDSSRGYGPSSGTKSPIKIMGEYGSNVLLVSAPKEKMPEIDKKVQEYIAAQGGDTTMVLRHFEVTKARPQEVADIIQPILDTKYREMQESSGGRREGYYPWFGPSSSSGPQISVNKITRKLMVMAPAELMPTVEELIREFDQASQASVTRTVTLKTAKAEEIAPIVQEHMKASAGPSPSRTRFRSWDKGFGDYSPWSSFRRSSSSSEGSEDLVVTAFEAGNSIILRGTEEKVYEAEQFIKMLDAGAQPEGPMIKVFQLEFADPYEVADYIDEVTGGGDSTSLTSAAPKRVSSSSSAISVKTDYATKRLIVAAAPERFPLIEQIIEIQERLAREAAARPVLEGDATTVVGAGGTVKKFYTVEGPAKEIAKRLDEIMYGMYGYKGPWVKYFPYTNQVMIDGDPKYFKSAEEWLAKLEKNPPPVALKVLVRRSPVAPSKVLPHLERIVTTSLREGAGIRKLEAGGVGRDPMSMLEEIYYDTPIEEIKPTTRPAEEKSSSARTGIDVVSQFLPTGVLARIDRDLAAIPLAQISVIGRNPATKPAVAPPTTRPAAASSVATRPSQVTPQPPTPPGRNPEVGEAKTAVPRGLPGQGGASDAAPANRVSGRQPGLGHPVDAALRDEMTAQERQTAELFRAAAEYRTSNKPQILYDELQGTFIIFGSEDEVEEIDEVLDMIIKEIGEIEEGAKGDIRVFRVKYIDVQIAASMLEAMFNEPAKAQPAPRAPRAQERKPQAKPGGAKPGEEEGEESAAQRRREEEEEQAKAKEAEEAAKAAAAGNIKVVPDPRTNTLIIRAAQETFPKIAELLLKIDRPGPDKVQNIKIFQLKKLNAAEVEEVLKEILKIETPQQRRTFRPRLPGRGGAGVDVDMIEALEQQMLEFQQSMFESGAPGTEGEGKEGKTKINPAKEISIASNATTNTIIVTAPEEGMKLVQTLIERLEEQDIPIDIKTVELQHAEAEKVAAQLEKVFETSQRRSAPGGMRGGMEGYTPSRMGDFKVSADSRTNRLVIRALQTDMGRILKIVEELDSTPSNPVEIYAVEKASAEDMAKTLSEIYGTQGGVGGAQIVRITADRSTNSLLVRAPHAQQLLIAAKIKDLEQQSVIQGEVRQIQLKVATPSTVASQLTQIFSPKSTARGTRQQINVVGEDASKMLFVTCPPDMFDEIKKIAEQMDQIIEQQVKVRPLTHAAAADILPKLNEMVAKLIAQTGLRGTGDAVFAATADERTNSLILAGTPKALMVVDAVIAELDVKGSDTTQPATRMFPLNRGNAASVAATINQLYGSKRWQAGVEAPKAAPDPVANVVFVTGTTYQLQLIEDQIIKPLEGYSPARPVEVAVNDYEVTVNYADVEELATRLTTMFSQGIQARKAAGDTSLTPLDTAMSIVPEPSTRKLFISCSAESKKKIDNWLKGLDVEAASFEGQQTKVLPVRVADLSYVSNALNAAFKKSGKVPASEQVTILPEYGTNTIIVKALKKDIDKIEQLLHEIDKEDRERMVAPEAIPVKHVLPTQLANRLTAMIRSSYAADKRTNQYPVSVEPNDTAGTLLVTAKNQQAMDSIKELIAKLDSQPAEDLRLTKPYVLKFADLASTQTMITKRFGKQDQLPVREQVVVDVDYSTGALVVTASEENHAKVREIIEDLDNAIVDDPKMPETIKVKNVRASLLAKTLTDMITQTMKPNKLTRQYPVTVQANDTANTLVMTANKADMERFKKIISELDVAPDVADTRMIRPYMLKFADPSVVTKAITDQFAGQEQRPLQEQVTAGPDYTTSSVFVTASEENHRKVQAIIDALDQSDASGRQTYTVDLKNVDPEDVAQTLTTVYNSGPRTRTGRIPAVFTPVPGARKLLVTCTPGELEQAKAMIEQLDISPREGGQKRAMRVVQVKKLPAREMMTMLTEYLRKPGKSGSRDPSLQDDIKITASDNADAVVLTGPEDRLDELQQLIEKVDSAVVDPSDPNAGGRQYAVIPLTNADPSSVAMVITQTYPARGNVPDSERVNAVAERATNSVVISASAEKLESIRKMINELDQQSTNVPQQEIIRLKNARAEDVLEVLRQTYQMGRRGMSSSGPPITFAADSNANALVVSAGKADMEGIKAMVAELDKPVTDEVDQLRIIPLQFVDAQETLEILNEYLRKPGAAAGGRRGSTSELIGDIRLQASATLNALIASGSQDELDRVEKIALDMDKQVEGAGAPKIIPVKNATAATLAGTLRELFANPTQSRSGRRTTQNDVPVIMSDDSTNSLVVRARTVDLNLIEDMVRQLDKQTEGPSGLEVIPVSRGVDVVSLARQIQDVINAGERAKVSSQSTYKPRQVAIAGEERSSTLIVSGSPELFETVRKLAADLEQKRPATGGRRALVVPVKTKSAQDIQKVLEAYIEQQNGRTQRRR